MEAIKIIKTIKSSYLPELQKFKGRKVEIIIIQEDTGKESKNNIDMLNEFIGSCPDLPDGMEYQNKMRREWS